jgi:hypothetical protein
MPNAVPNLKKNAFFEIIFLKNETPMQREFLYFRQHKTQVNRKK